MASLGRPTHHATGAARWREHNVRVVLALLNRVRASEAILTNLIALLTDAETADHRLFRVPLFTTDYHDIVISTEF